MGANTSTGTDTHVHIPRDEYFEKAKYYGNLEKMLNDEKLKCKLLKKTLEETKAQVARQEDSLKAQRERAQMLNDEKIK